MLHRPRARHRLRTLRTAGDDQQVVFVLEPIPYQPTFNLIMFPRSGSAYRRGLVRREVRVGQDVDAPRSLCKGRILRCVVAVWGIWCGDIGRGARNAGAHERVVGDRAVPENELQRFGRIVY